jgi:plasmid stability protein
MAQLTIRHLEDNVYARLKDRARSNHRSLEAEVRAILAQEVRPDRSAVVRRANEFRRRLAGRYGGDVTAEIRADRNR